MSDEKVDLESIKRLHAELMEAASQLSRETNGDKIIQGAKALQARSQHLAAQAERFAAYERLRNPEIPSGVVRVALTAEQRQRIATATGYTLDELVIEDATVSTNEMMPYMEPEQIELMALRQAERHVAEQQAEIAAREQVRAAFAGVEAVDNEDYKKMVDKVKKDPNFMNGALQGKT